MVTPAENDLIEALIAAGQNATSIRAAVPTVSRTNIYLKMAKYRKHGTVSRIETKPIGRPRSSTNDTEKFLSGSMAAKPGIELEEMQGHVSQVLGLSVSTSTISRTISRSGLGVRGRGRRKVARASAKVMWKGGQSDQSPGGGESEEGGEGFDDADESQAEESQADESQTEASSMGRGRAGSAPPGPVMGPVSLAHATGRGSAARRIAEADAVAAAASTAAPPPPPPPPPTATATNNFAPAPLPQSLPYARQEPAPPRRRFIRPSAQSPPQRSIWEDDGSQIEHSLDPSLVWTPALPQAPKRRGVPRYGVPGTTSGAVDTPVAPVAPMTARVYHSPYPPVA